MFVPLIVPVQNYDAYEAYAACMSLPQHGYNAFGPIFCRAICTYTAW